MVSDREALDKQILAGENVPVDTLKQILTGATPPVGDIRVRYAEQLLKSALETRDPDTMERAADLMDAEPEMDEALAALLNETLLDQPDAVYAFVRAHLPKDQEKRWVRRLKLAALFSLRVAINDADTDTIVSWLTLVAREPAGYDLGDVLHFGILSAQERAHQDPELARQLVLLAAKRDPASLDMLLDDPALMVALPNNIGLSLREMNGDAVLLLQNRGIEIFLVALARAARARSGTMFNPATVANVWELYTNGQPIGMLPAHYQAESIIAEWTAHGIEFLKLEALETLLRLILSSKRNDLLLEMFRHPDAPTALLPMFVLALESAERSINEALDLIARLVGDEAVTPQQAIDLLIYMLDGQEWSAESLPLMQQLARMIHQYSGLNLTLEVLWKLLTAAGAVRDEFIARIAIKRLVNNLETVDDDAELIEFLRQMALAASWSENVRQHVTNWWRDFTRDQSLTRLGKLEKVIEGKRSLDEERDILHTLIALRRMLGGRSLETFAADVKTAYNVLQGLFESFDPNNKRHVAFDPPTVREELNARQDQLPPEARQVLANNLKELAHLVADMGDNRTKSNLIRRGEDLDRDLMSGEQPPHSAVDAMKWLSGYWGASREETSEDQT